MKKIFLILIGVSACAVFARAQATPGEEDFQSWNDIQITARMTEHFDYLFQLTGRFGDRARQLNDQRIAAGFIWKVNKSLSITPFFEYINARNSAGRFRDEQELNFRVSYRLPIKKFSLVHRSQYEYRIRSPQNSWRYRSMLSTERDLFKSLIPKSKVFVNDEVFYDSLLRRFFRNRLTAGINKTLNKYLSLDLYFMRQNDGFSQPGNLSVVGANWRVHF